MKKHHLAWTVFLVCAMLLIPGAAKAADGPVIVDHTCADIWKIPESAIEQAKNSIHIAYGHTSHGSQLISGMGSSGTQPDAFMTDNGASPGLYVWHDGPQAGALDLDDYFVKRRSACRAFRSGGRRPLQRLFHRPGMERQLE